MKLSKHCRFPVYNYDMIEAGNHNPAGSIIWMMGEAVPLGYLLCDGSAVGRNNYPDLFAAIGTTYGEGDGSTTFNLPDLMDKFVEGSDTAGTEKSAGLPNITGSFIGDRLGWYGATSNQTGAIKFEDASSSTGWCGAAYENGGKPSRLIFNAADSNTIYGNSNTVQPESLTAMPCIKAYNDISVSNSKSGGRGIAYEPDTEVFTGDYWIDGKPIYAYVFTNQSIVNGTELDNILNIDKFIECLLINGRNFNSRYSYIQKTAFTGSASINTNNNKIAIYLPNGYSEYSWESLLLKYTKTTD